MRADIPVVKSKLCAADKAKHFHRFTSLRAEGSKAEPLVCAVEETPLACAIAVADLPWLATLNHAAQAIACGRAETFACLKIISPMLCGRNKHNRYLSVFNSEEAQAGGLALSGVPSTSVSILYHISHQKSRGLCKFLCELYVTNLWTECELQDRDCESKVHIFEINNLQIVNKSFKRPAAGDRGPASKITPYGSRDRKTRRTRHPQGVGYDQWESRGLLSLPREVSRDRLLKFVTVCPFPLDIYIIPYLRGKVNEVFVTKLLINYEV